jgi:hypothetical protein
VKEKKLNITLRIKSNPNDGMKLLGYLLEVGRAWLREVGLLWNATLA